MSLFETYSIKYTRYLGYGLVHLLRKISPSLGLQVSYDTSYLIIRNWLDRGIQSLSDFLKFSKIALTVSYFFVLGGSIFL